MQRIFSFSAQMTRINETSECQDPKDAQLRPKESIPARLPILLQRTAETGATAMTTLFMCSFCIDPVISQAVCCDQSLS